jgi:AraC-like DNA-binding protein
MVDSTGKPTVYASAINQVLQAAGRFGVNREQLLALEHLEPGWLSQPDERLPVERLFEVYRLAAEFSRCPDLGLYVGRVNFFRGLNLLLYMSTICSTFKDYLNLVPSILKMAGDIGEVVIERDQELLRLEWRPLVESTAQERFLSDEILGSSQAIVNALCIDPIPVRRAHFSYPKPKDTSQLELVFGQELHFDQEVSCLFFDRIALRSPVIQLDYELSEGFTHSLRDLFEDEQTKDPFLASVRRELIKALPAGEVTIDHLATELGVSRRTLQRRLAERDTHFMQVLSEVRAELAARYLNDKRLGITEIAFLLGYSDPASFSTAFRSWYGSTPSEFRAD